MKGLQGERPSTAGGVGDLLIAVMTPRCGRDDIHDARGMIERRAEDAEMFGGGFDVHLGFVPPVSCAT